MCIHSERNISLVVVVVVVVVLVVDDDDDDDANTLKYERTKQWDAELKFSLVC